MKLSAYGQMIKAELAMELEKAGSSLAELEAGLKNINTAEGAMKVASDLNLMQDFVTRPAIGAASSLPGLALNASAAGGALAGMTFDEMDRGVVDLNSALDRERQKVLMIKRLTHNLKKEHGIN